MASYYVIDIVAAYVYAIAAVIILVIGYIKTSLALFDVAQNGNDDVAATLAWFPIGQFAAAARLAGKKKTGIVLLAAGIGTVVSTLITLVLSIITQKASAAGIAVSAVLYAVQAVADCIVFNAYFKKYKRNIGRSFVLLSAFIPLFKYYLPFGEEK